MAVPSITQIIPNSGPPHGGYKVLILGSNFREPASVPFSQRQVTVHVFIGSAKISDEWVSVISSNEIEIRMIQDESDPAIVVYPLSRDVTVKNVDDSGLPIPGEETTAANAWLYARMPDAITVPEEHVFRWLRRYLARNLSVTVTGSVHVDYKESGLFVLPKEATLPCIVLVGPRLMPAPDGTTCLQNGDDSLGTLRLPKAYNYIYDVMLLDNHRKRLGALRMKLTEAIRVMPAGSISWAGGFATIQARWQDPPSLSSVADFMGAVEQALGVLVVENVPEISDMIQGGSSLITTLDLEFE